MTTSQALIAYEARCTEGGCGADCYARNALAWAHNHARHTGHRVELMLGYSVSPARWVMTAPPSDPARKVAR